MAHRLDAVMAAVVAALEVASVGGTAKPAGLTVHRERIRPLETEGLPAMCVYWGGDDPPDEFATDKFDNVAHIWVEARAQQSGATPDAAYLPLMVWAQKAVMTDWFNTRLGGTAALLRRGRSEPLLDENGTPLCGVSVEFIVTYQTSFKDPEN